MFYGATAHTQCEKHETKVHGEGRQATLPANAALKPSTIHRRVVIRFVGACNSRKRHKTCVSQAKHWRANHPQLSMSTP